MREAPVCGDVPFLYDPLKPYLCWQTLVNEIVTLDPLSHYNTPVLCWLGICSVLFIVLSSRLPLGLCGLGPCILYGASYCISKKWINKKLIRTISKKRISAAEPGLFLEIGLDVSESVKRFKIRRHCHAVPNVSFCSSFGISSFFGLLITCSGCRPPSSLVSLLVKPFRRK